MGEEVFNGQMAGGGRSLGLLAATGALALAPRVALAQDAAQGAALAAAADVTASRAWLVVLAVVLVATAVQLVIEVAWNYVEWVLISTRGWQPTDLNSPQYLQFKGGTSLVFGALVGVIVANLTGMRLFEYLQPLLPAFVSGVPVAIDVLLTGLLIGAVTRPVHDIFGLLGRTRELIGNLAIKKREEASDALASGVLKLAQSEAQALVDVPSIGPARLPVPGGAEEPGEGGKSPTERYVELLHNRTMM